MTKGRIMPNLKEKGKWEFTKWFVDKYVNSQDLVLETHAGTGDITELYSNQLAITTACEIDKRRFEQLRERFEGIWNVVPLQLDSLRWLTQMKTNCDLWDIIDIDPFFNANFHLHEAFRIMNNGYVLFSSGEPYMMTKYKRVIDNYGGEPMKDWKKYPAMLFDRFVHHAAKKFGKRVELRNCYASPKVCRLLLEVSGS